MPPPPSQFELPLLAERPASSRLLWIARFLALAAAGLSTYLGWASAAQQGRVAGCGDQPGFDCASVLTSRWSAWLGLPVGFLASLVYLGLLAALVCVGPEMGARAQRNGWRIALPLAALAAGAACWFSGLQLLVLHSLCSFCLAVHGLGIAVALLVFWLAPWRRALPLPADKGRVGGAAVNLRPRAPWLSIAAGLCSVAALIAGQLLARGPETHMDVVELPAAKDARTNPFDNDHSASPAAPVPVASGNPAAAGSNPPSASPLSSSGGDRQLKLLNGQITLHVVKLPRLGPADAPAIVLELFDYTCPHCRQMHHYLSEVRARYGAQLVLIVLPMPMNKHCNPYVQLDDPQYKDACDFARLAWAVWYAKPAAFAAFHDWLLQSVDPPSVAAARRKAEELVGRDELETGLADERIDRQIAAAGRIYQLAGLGTIPKLLGEGFVNSGLPANADELAKTLAKQLDLRP